MQFLLSVHAEVGTQHDEYIYHDNANVPVEYWRKHVDGTTFTYFESINGTESEIQPVTWNSLLPLCINS